MQGPEAQDLKGYFVTGYLSPQVKASWPSANYVSWSQTPHLQGKLVRQEYVSSLPSCVMIPTALIKVSLTFRNSIYSAGDHPL